MSLRLGATRITGSPAVTKTSVGLVYVDNTSDVDKPVSTAQQAAITAVSNDCIHKNSNNHLVFPDGSEMWVG